MNETVRTESSSKGINRTFISVPVELLVTMRPQLHKSLSDDDGGDIFERGKLETVKEKQHTQRERVRETGLRAISVI